MPSSCGNKTERNSRAQISQDTGIALCVEADNRQLIRGYPCNVSVSGQQLLLTDTQLQIKQISMCVCGGGAPVSRTGKQTGAGGLRSALFFSANPPRRLAGASRDTSSY